MNSTTTCELNALGRCSRLSILLTACALAAVLVSPAAAAPVNYGNLVGTTVTYQNVTEDNTRISTPAVGPAVVSSDPFVYGTPGILADSLFFGSSSFGVAASGGAKQTLDGKLTTRIVASPGNVIAQIQWIERGDYTLFGGVGNSAQVTAPLQIRIEELSTGAITPITVATFLTFNPSAGDYFSPGENGITVPWTGAITVDLDAIIAANSLVGRATKVTFSLDNILIAKTATGTAQIRKKQAAATLEVVPEPSSFVLLALGLVGVAGLRFRKR